MLRILSLSLSPHHQPLLTHVCALSLSQKRKKGRRRKDRIRKEKKRIEKGLASPQTC